MIALVVAVTASLAIIGGLGMGAFAARWYTLRNVGVDRLPTGPEPVETPASPPHRCMHAPVQHPAFGLGLPDRSVRESAGNVR